MVTSQDRHGATTAMDGARQPGRALMGSLAARSVRIRGDLPVVLLDLLLAAMAYTTILLVRFDLAVPPRYLSVFPAFLLTAVAVHLVTNWVFGLYGEVWRHAGVHEARRILQAGAASVAVLAAAFLPGRRDLPLSVVVLGGACTVLLFGVVRFQARLFAIHRSAARGPVTRVIVIGGGEAGAAIIRDMLAPGSNLEPVAVIDEDPRKWGRSIHGVPVVGGLDRIADVCRRTGAEQALLAIPSADGELVRRMAYAADAAQLALKVLPSVTELVNGRVSVRHVRDLRITDLLGRTQVRTDLEAVGALLRGRRVLVTGGGGSIGSEIARQVSVFDPAELVLLDHDETHLHDAGADVDDRCVQVLADVRDREVVADVFARHRPEIVFHAAAHKHVPLLESHPSEAVRTNVVGTLNVADAAAAHGAERLVLISTDKAVRPSNVMGASKRLAEQIVLQRSGQGRRFCAVRFGNVLGSRGSVIPRFMRQIERGGPITVTDPRMTRFFMSIPEAVQLVLQAAAFAEGADVYLLEMGEAVRIVDLAERMIRLSGRRVGHDVAIRIVGPRPGEKLAEELFLPEEEPRPTPHPAVVALHPPLLDAVVLARGLRELDELAGARREDEVRRLLYDLAGASGTVLVLPDQASTIAAP